MNNFPWLFEKPFERITVQTRLPKQSSNKPKIPQIFLVTLLAIVFVAVRCAWHCYFDKKYQDSAGLTIFLSKHLQTMTTTDLPPENYNTTTTKEKVMVGIEK